MGGPFFRKIAFLVVSRFVLLIGLRLAKPYRCRVVTLSLRTPCRHI